jgi:hypothetical protein
MRFQWLDVLSGPLVAAILGGLFITAAAEPQSHRYRVSVYSGGECIREWVTLSKPAVWSDAKRVDVGELSVIGGTVIIEPVPNRTEMR